MVFSPNTTAIQPTATNPGQYYRGHQEEVRPNLVPPKAKGFFWLSPLTALCIANVPLLTDKAACIEPRAGQRLVFAPLPSHPFLMVRSAQEGYQGGSQPYQSNRPYQPFPGGASCDSRHLSSTMDRLNRLVSFYHSFIRNLKRDTMQMSMAQLTKYVKKTLEGYKRMKMEKERETRMAGQCQRRLESYYKGKCKTSKWKAWPFKYVLVYLYKMSFRGHSIFSVALWRRKFSPLDKQWPKLAHVLHTQRRVGKKFSSQVSFPFVLLVSVCVPVLYTAHTHCF